MPSGGTAKFHEVFERTTKEMPASASNSMKIKVVAPPVSTSSWHQTLPLRGSVVPAKLSACGIHGICFLNTRHETSTSARICTPMSCRQAARNFSKGLASAFFEEPTALAPFTMNFMWLLCQSESTQHGLECSHYPGRGRWLIIETS